MSLVSLRTARAATLNRRLRRGALAVGLMSVAWLATLAAPAGAVVTTINGQNFGVMPRSVAAHSGAAGRLDYHAGPVMHSTASYAVYWDPSGQYDGDWRSLINRFLGDVATDSGTLTNVFATTSQYTDATGRASYANTFRGAYSDQTAYPTNGNCADAGSVCLTDAQVRSELASFVASHGLSTGLGTTYFLLTPPSVTVCADGGGSGGHCSDGSSTNSFCSYHAVIGTGGPGTIVYAVVPWTVGTLGTWDALGQTAAVDCQDGGWNAAQDGGGIGNSGVEQQPNQLALDHDGDTDLGLADMVIGEVANQQVAMVTDPLFTGWWDNTNQNEDADMCRNWFEPALGGAFKPQQTTGAGTLFDQRINQHGYYLNTVFANAAQDSDFPGAPCVPGVNLVPDFSAPTAVNVGDQIALDGSQTNATLGVINYHWDFGDGVTSTSSQGSTVHSYGHPGTYAVTLTVTDRGANTATLAQSVVVVTPTASGVSGLGGSSPGFAPPAVNGANVAGQAPLTLPAVVAGGPKITDSISSTSLARALKNGLLVHYSVNEEVAGRFELILDGGSARRLGVHAPTASGLAAASRHGAHPVVVGSAMLVTSGATSEKLVIHFTGGLAKRLQRSRSLALTVRLTVVDLAGKRAVLTRALKLGG